MKGKRRKSTAAVTLPLPRGCLRQRPPKVSGSEDCNSAMQGLRQTCCKEAGLKGLIVCRRAGTQGWNVCFVCVCEDLSS